MTIQNYFCTFFQIGKVFPQPFQNLISQSSFIRCASIPRIDDIIKNYIMNFSDTEGIIQRAEIILEYISRFHISFFTLIMVMITYDIKNRDSGIANYRPILRIKIHFIIYKIT